MRKYFPTKNPDDGLVDALQQARENARMQNLRDFPSRVRRLARSVWFDIAPQNLSEFSSAEVLRGGEQGEQLRHRINEARQLGGALAQVIGSPAVAWQATADNTDVETTKESNLGSQILQSLWKHRGLEVLCRSALTAAMYDGEGFIFGGWDYGKGEFVLASEDDVPARAGDLTLEYVPAHRVIRPSRDSFAACEWFDVTLPRNRYDLAAVYPEQEEAILKAPAYDYLEEGYFQTNATPDDDIVALRVFLHKRTAAVPDGLHVCYLDGVKEPLYHGSLRTQQLPLQELQPWGEVAETPYGYSQWWLVMATQEISDWVQSAASTNTVTHGHGIIVVDANDDMPVEQIGNGPMVIKRKSNTGVEPKAINLSAVSPEAFGQLDRFSAKMRSLVGLNDIILGQSPSAEQNAQAFTLLYSAAVQQQAEPQKRWADFLRRVGQLVMELYSAHATEEQKLQIVGKDQRHLLTSYVSFTGKDVQGIKAVAVELSNPASQTTAGNIALANELADRGWVVTPEQYVQIRDTGKLTALEQAPRLEYELIAWENQELREGRPIAVSFSDKHSLHYTEHAALLKDPAVRTSPEHVSLVQAHLQEHVQTLASIPPIEAALSGNVLPGGAVAPPEDAEASTPPAGEGAPADVAAPAPMEAPVP